MPDLESIIGEAVSDATDGGDAGGGDVEVVVETGADAGGTSAAPVAGAGADGVAAAVVDPAVVADPAVAAAAAAATVDPLTKELEELGLKAPKDGERENRLPYSRVRKIVENNTTKLKAAHTTEMTQLTTRLTAAEEKAQLMSNVDQVIVSDPDRYIGMLAAMHPNLYGKFVSGGKVAAPVVGAETVAAADPMPKPDVQFQDGSAGYSPEGVQKLLDWQSRQTEARVMGTVEKRFGPIEQQHKAAQLRASLEPKIQAQLKSATDLWGKPFTDDYNLGAKSEILQFMKAHPEVPFEAAVSTVLVPKMIADRTSIRQSVLAEINARPAAAAKAVPAAAGAAVSTEPQSLEDVIRASVTAAGLTE